jgi:lipid-A-disaccharide synthase-like uncharacterized protein
MRLKAGAAIVGWCFLLAVIGPTVGLFDRGGGHDERVDSTPVAGISIHDTLRGSSGVTLICKPDGSTRYLVQEGQEVAVELTPDEYARRLYDDQSHESRLHRVLNISSPVGVAWVALGFAGQLLFAGRMVVQWLASERSNRSMVPDVFWWMSLGGSLMLLAYFIWRQDIVGATGQGTGTFIYVRNLMLIHRTRAAAAGLEGIASPKKIEGS